MTEQLKQEKILRIKKMDEFQKKFDLKYNVKSVHVCVYCGKICKNLYCSDCKTRDMDEKFRLYLEDEETTIYLSFEEYSQEIYREYAEENTDGK